jgi:hypothetical protein
MQKTNLKSNFISLILAIFLFNLLIMSIAVAQQNNGMIRFIFSRLNFDSFSTSFLNTLVFNEGGVEKINAYWVVMPELLLSPLNLFGSEISTIIQFLIIVLIVFVSLINNNSRIYLQFLFVTLALYIFLFLLFFDSLLFLVIFYFCILSRLMDSKLKYRDLSIDFLIFILNPIIYLLKNIGTQKIYTLILNSFLFLGFYLYVTDIIRDTSGRNPFVSLLIYLDDFKFIYLLLVVLLSFLINTNFKSLKTFDLPIFLYLSCVIFGPTSISLFMGSGLLLLLANNWILRSRQVIGLAGLNISFLISLYVCNSLSLVNLPTLFTIYSFLMAALHFLYSKIERVVY